MSTDHREKYIINLLLGVVLLIPGIFSIIYAASERAHNNNWFFGGIIASALVTGALYFLLIAVIHKVKSDIIKRQRYLEHPFNHDRKTLQKTYYNVLKEY